MRRNVILCCVVAAGMLSGCTLDDVKEVGQTCPPTRAYCEQTLGETLGIMQGIRISEFCDVASRCGNYGSSHDDDCRNEEVLLCQRYICDMTKMLNVRDDSVVWEEFQKINVEDVSASSGEYQGGACTAAKPYCMWIEDGHSGVTFSCQAGGAVVCANGQVLCNGRCVDPLTDPQYCGADEACRESSYTDCTQNATDKICTAGQCSSSCPALQRDCNGVCLDWTSNHVSQCDGTTITCSGEDYADCDEDVANGCEIDLSQDSANCGACGHVCEQGEVCVEKECVVNSCSGNQTLCSTASGNTCIDINGSDANNCGGCGYTCVDQPQANVIADGCLEGVCQYQCDAGYQNAGTAVSPKCIDTTADSKNCGSVGNQCVSGMVCVNSECVINECPDGQTLCATTSGNTCIDTKGTDINNCGACGYTCVDQPQTNVIADVCSNGVCQYRCKEGYANAGTATAPNCVDTMTDGKNCGAVGNDCTKIANVKVAYCNEGTCAVATCQSGYHIYDATCESNTIDNCGAHGNKCITGNVKTAKCSTDGQCIATACQSGYHVYDEACEADDNSNCGAHGNKCVTGNVKTAICSTAGKCTATTCQSGYHVYNATCEADDNSNCGAHGVECSASDFANSSLVSCSTGTCMVTTCKLGYTLVDGACKLAPAIKDECGSASMVKCPDDSKMAGACCRSLSACNSGDSICMILQ